MSLGLVISMGALNVPIISWTGVAICTAVADAVVDDSTSIAWESVYKIPRSWVDVLIFLSSYLELCIWPVAISQWIRQRNSIRKILTETLAMIRQAFGEKCVNRTRVFEWHARLRAD
jgi:hypothetical protein